MKLLLEFQKMASFCSPLWITFEVIKSLAGSREIVILLFLQPNCSCVQPLFYSCCHFYSSWLLTRSLTKPTGYTKKDENLSKALKSTLIKLSPWTSLSLSCWVLWFYTCLSLDFVLMFDYTASHNPRKPCNISHSLADISLCCWYSSLGIPKMPVN